MYGSVPLVMSQDTHLSVRIDKVPPGWSSFAQVGVPVISEKFDSN